MNPRPVAAALAVLALFAFAPTASSGPAPRVYCAAFEVPSGIAGIAADGQRAGVAMVPTAAELPAGWTPQGGTSIGGKPAVIACGSSPP